MNDEVTAEDMKTLQQVTALEVWCLCAAIISLISAGDQQMARAITAMADDLHQKIVNGDVSDPE